MTNKTSARAVGVLFIIATSAFSLSVMNGMVTKLSRLLLMLCLLVYVIPTTATEEEDLAAGVLGSALEIEHIRSKIQTLTDSSEESDSKHLESLDLYKRALTYLIKADNYSRKSALFKQALNSATGDLQQRQEELAQANHPNATDTSELLASASVQELEQRLVKRQAEQFAVEKKLTELFNRITIEQSRPNHIQLELTELQRALEQLKLSQRSADSLVISEAQQIEQQSHRQMLSSHADMLQQELLSHETRLQQLSAQRDLFSQRVAISELEVKQLQGLVNQRRSELADRLNLELDQAQAEASDKPALIREVTEQNARLSDQFTQLTSRIENAVEKRDAAASELKQLEQRFRYTRQQLEIAGQTEALGEVLRSDRSYLTELRRTLGDTAGLQSEIAQAGLSRLQTEKQRDALANEEQRLNQKLLTIDVAMSEPERQALRSVLAQLLEYRGELLQAVANADKSYLQALHGLDSESQKLIDTVDRFSVLLNKRLLWVTSTSRLGFSWVSDLRRSFSWFFSMSTWTEIGSALRQEASSRLLLTILVLATTAGLFSARRRMSVRLEHTAQYIGNVQSDRISHTVEAIGITILFATPWALMMSYFGWILTQSDNGPGALTVAAGRGLLAAAAIMFLLSTYRWLVKNRGVAEMHFDWSDQARHVAWHNLRWFLILVVPLAFVIYMAEAQHDEVHRAAIGRLAFIGASIALIIFARRQ